MADSRPRLRAAPLGASIRNRFAKGRAPAQWNQSQPTGISAEPRAPKNATARAKGPGRNVDSRFCLPKADRPLLDDDDLDPAVLAVAGAGSGERLVEAVAGHREARLVGALGGEIVDHRLGAALRQLEIELPRADRVGVAFDAELLARERRRGQRGDDLLGLAAA